MSTAPTTTHPVAPEELMALLDGELSADRASSVSAHAAACEACRRVSAELQQVHQGIASWQVSAAPTALHELFAKAGVALPSTASAMDRLRRTKQWSRKQWAMGASFAVAALLFLALATTSSRKLAPSAPSVDRARQWEVQTRLSTAEDSALAPPAKPMEGHGEGHGNAPRITDQLQASDTDSNGPARGAGDHLETSFALNGTLPADQPAHLSSAPMIARTVALAILVKDFDPARKTLDSILVRYNSYSANLTVNTPQGASRSLNASLRIPAPQLAAALAELRALGHVQNESQNGEEVTQQHADLLARLKNSRETEQRLQAILTQRTGKISDVLEVEQEIARVRGEIEQMEADQKNLEHRVDFATVDLSLSEEYKAKLDSAVPSFSTRFHNAAVNGYRNASDSLVGLLLFVAEYGPIVVFWIALLLLPGWLFWRRYRQATASGL